jgi:hypothetical protein
MGGIAAEIVAFADSRLDGSALVGTFSVQIRASLGVALRMPEVALTSEE